ncbi:phospho-N-acetylmuramoyl-pentapeptide-transferase [Candidatus Berkelbacteria bacterium]|nr:phospho-N-acetylmuramoyl-pentapeptide-transferase [Candidatus Berkelbacteria bacterium]
MTKTIIWHTQDFLLIFLLVVVAFVITIALTPLLTAVLYHFKLWKKPKSEAITGEKAAVYQKLHGEKHRRHVPTMAGILVWFVVTALTLLFNKSRAQTYLPTFTLVSFGLLGLVDDLINVRQSNGVAGLRFWMKMFWLIALSSLGAWWFYYKLGFSAIHVPLGEKLFGLPPLVEIGWFYIPLFILVIVSTANAVNLTDGLDGLAGGLLSVVFGAYVLIALTQGKLALAAFCGTLVGATLAYTWFNIYPARFFMGDTGSLALGATLGVIAMLTNTALVLPIIGFVFVIDTLSSIIQIASKKLTGRKVFIVAPLHHHLEAMGWPETKVTMRLWVIGTVFAVVGLFIALLGRG